MNGAVTNLSVHCYAKPEAMGNQGAAPSAAGVATTVEKVPATERQSPPTIYSTRVRKPTPRFERDTRRARYLRWHTDVVACPRRGWTVGHASRGRGRGELFPHIVRERGVNHGLHAAAYTDNASLRSAVTIVHRGRVG